VNYLVLGCRGLLAGIFLVSLFGKLRGRAAYGEFVTATGTLLLVSHRAERVLATLALTAECLVALMLVVPVPVAVSFAAAIALLCSFTGALVRALRRGEDTSCHCFGASTTPIGAHHVARNLVLIAIAAAGLTVELLTHPSRYQLAGIAITVLTVLPCLLLVTRLDDLVELFRTPG
jgi:hypothetical protein